MASAMDVVSNPKCKPPSPALKAAAAPRTKLRALLAIQKLHTETSGVLKLVIWARPRNPGTNNGTAVRSAGCPWARAGRSDALASTAPGTPGLRGTAAICASHAAPVVVAR
eukprot:scaffold6931_cov119-Isochrysis_galbana.AAC.7